MRALQDLTDQRPWAFVQGLLLDPHASLTQAAMGAGYAPRSAKQQGSRLMTRHDVAAALEEGRAKLAERFEISIDSVTQEMAAIAKSNIDQIFEFDDEGGPVRLKPGKAIPKNARKAIKAMKVKTRWRVTAPVGTAGPELDAQPHGGALARRRFKRPEEIVAYFDQPAEERPEEDQVEIIEVEQTVEVTLWEKPTGLEQLAKHVGVYPAGGGGDGDGSPARGGILVNVFTGAVPQVGADGEVRVPATISEAMQAQEARTTVGGVGVAVRVIGPTN